MGAKSLNLLNMRINVWGFVKGQSFAFLRKRVIRVQFLLSLALGSLSQATQAGVLWDDLKSCMANPKLCVTAIKSSISTGTSSIADMRRNFLLQYAILKNSPQLLAQLEDILGPLALSEVDKLKIKQLQEKYAKVKLADDPSKYDLKGFSKELVDILSHGNINPDLLAKISEPLESAGLLVHSQLDESGVSSAFTNEANKETASSADFDKRIENMAASGGEISNPSKANLVEEKNSKSSALSSRSDEETLDGAKVINNVASNFKGSKLSSAKKLEVPSEEIIPFDGRAPSSIPLASSNSDGSTGAGGSADLLEEFARSPASTSAKQVHGNGDSSSSSSSSASSGGASSSAPIKGSGSKTTESSGSSGTGTPSETASVDTQQNGLGQNNGAQDKTQNASNDSQTNDRHVSSDDSGASAKNTDTQERSTEDFKPKEDPAKVEAVKTGVTIKGPETFKATAPEVKTADTTSVFTRQFLDAQKSKEFVRAFTSNKDVVSTPDLSEGVISMIAQGNYQQAEALIRALNPEYVEEYEKQKAKDDEVLHLTQMEKAGEISKEVLQEEVAKIIESKEKLNNSRVERRMKKKDEKSASTNTATEPLQIVSEAIAAASRNVAETSKLEIRRKDVRAKLENNLKNPHILNSKELEQCKLFYNNIFLGSSDTVIEGVKNSTKYNGNYLDTSELKCQNLKESWRRSLNTYLMPRDSVSRNISPNYKEDLLYYCSSAYLKISAYNKLASSEAEEYIEKGLKPITSYAKYSVSDLAREDNLEIQAKLMLVAEPEELLCASLIPEYSLKKQSDLGKLHDFYKCGQGARSEKILPLYFDKRAYEKRQKNAALIFPNGINLNDQMIEATEGSGMPVYSRINMTTDGEFAKTAFMFNFFKTIEIENNHVQVPLKPFDTDELGQRLSLLEASKRSNPGSLAQKLKSDRSYTAKLYELLYGSCSQTFVGEGDACRKILSQENADMVKVGLTKANQRASRDLDKVKTNLLSDEGKDKFQTYRDIVVKNLCRQREPASTSVHSK